MWRAKAIATVAACALACCLKGAAAFSNAASCDLIVLSKEGGDAGISPEAWDRYRTQIQRLLSRGREGSEPPGQLANELVREQERTLATVPAAHLAAYLKSSRCQLLISFDRATLEILDSENALDPRFAPLRSALKSVVEAAITDLTNSLPRARFGSPEARRLYQAERYCFVASLIETAKSSHLRADGLVGLGQTVMCSQLDRRQ
jgi:hypothetical protein